MNKAQLIERIAEDAGITKKQANHSLNSFTDAIVSNLKKGNNVTLAGFGTFSVSNHAARNGRNPQTGAIIKIKARKLPKFKTSKDFFAKIADSPQTK